MTNVWGDVVADKPKTNAFGDPISYSQGGETDQGELASAEKVSDLAVAAKPTLKEKISRDLASGLGVATEQAERLQPTAIVGTISKNIADLPYAVGHAINSAIAPEAPRIDPEKIKPFIRHAITGATTPSIGGENTAAEGVVSGTANVIAGLASPETAVAIASGAAAPEVVGKLFLTDIAGQLPGSVDRILSAKTSKQLAEAGVELAAQVGTLKLIHSGLSRAEVKPGPMESLVDAEARRGMTPTQPAISESTLDRLEAEAKSPETKTAEVVGPATAQAVAETKGIENAPTAQQIESGVQPQRIETETRGIPAEASPSDSVQRAAQGEPLQGSVNAPELAGIAQGEARNPVEGKFRLRSTPDKVEGEIEGETGTLTVRAPTSENPDGTHSVNSLTVFVPPGILDPRVAPRQEVKLSTPITGKTKQEARQKAYQQFTDTLNKGEFATQQPTIEGLGGAVPSEFPADPGNPDIYGVAQRVREERAKAGQVAEVVPGEGISAPDSVQKGREILRQDPAAGEKAVAAFEADPAKGISAEGMAASRAHGERLAYEARRIEEQFGTNSDEFHAAWQRLSDWDQRTKPMQTEWHKIGMAQQGETDIDTGSFTGLQRAFKEDTGQDFNPKQAETAKEKAGKVRQADEAANTAQAQLLDHFRQKGPPTDAEKKALDAANKVVRDWAARKAELETEARVAKSKSERDAAIARRKEEQKAVDAANKVIRDNARRMAKRSEAERIGRADPREWAWKKAREYIAAGMDDFNDIRNKIATDMGVSVKEVTAAIGKDKRAKFLADDVWRKQQTARLLKQEAKRWLKEQATPALSRALQKVPRVLFGLKVGFHGTVALGTHAPMVAFQPRFWASYVSNFGKMYKMVGTLTPGGQRAAKAYYENQIQDLIRRPNYITARRAGLVNDPFTYEDFNSPDTAKYFGNITSMGNRGYTVLKLLRQDMFDQMWNKLPRTAKYNEVASALADGINHATGVVKGSAPTGANLALFAPRLEASRVAWLSVDPVKALSSVANWKNASQAEKIFAVNQLKEKAWVAGTFFGLLALNQGMLSAMNSKQKVNGIPEVMGGKGFDPMRSDFMKFKVAGMDFSYGNAMLSMARLPVRLYAIRESSGGKLKNLIHPDESTYSVLGEYARSQLSPFASLASSLWFKSDWQNRPLPSSDRPVPKRLRQQGVEQYTWPEFWSEQVLPIPLEEAAREVWSQGLGMSPEQVEHMFKAVATISVMAATGGRLVEDRDVQP